LVAENHRPDAMKESDKQKAVSAKFTNLKNSSNQMAGVNHAQPG
jgi:hypothetical protein